MSTLAEKPQAPTAVNDAEYIWAVHPVEGNVRRPLSTLVPYINGYSGSARGFFGASPITQPAHADQASYTLTVGATLTITGTQSSPWGFASQSDLNNLVARVNELRADILGVHKLLTAIRSALVALGLMKGEA
ncbi:hypothetical protein [Chelatococcus sp. XZ-Ab1]|uniref:hypothetical protein n=1 Tax=Chelatococcus sp. XZ-Ab1 TaxID=3034027 RepID=UPI0023E3E1CE|nr:hypothetical protein [Chelatococcus sp. XZ-Ab1]